PGDGEPLTVRGQGQPPPHLVLLPRAQRPQFLGGRRVPEADDSRIVQGGEGAAVARQGGGDRGSVQVERADLLAAVQGEEADRLAVRDGRRLAIRGDVKDVRAARRREGDEALGGTAVV